MIMMMMKPSGCDGLNIFLALLESCSKCSPCFANGNVSVATALTKVLSSVSASLFV